MNTEEKSENKDNDALIIRKYMQYLKLEKALAGNTQEAYMQDLEKLLNFLKAENIDFRKCTYENLQQF